ncbi:MAG: hypothetical protein FRX49_03439 [Trebouxia sp. A1-2]|nr:MAG: hypothetical protein FRX49_03439 [Trebouxia sp. A1-2]
MRSTCSLSSRKRSRTSGRARSCCTFLAPDSWSSMCDVYKQDHLLVIGVFLARFAQPSRHELYLH